MKAPVAYEAKRPKPVPLKWHRDGEDYVYGQCRVTEVDGPRGGAGWWRASIGPSASKAHVTTDKWLAPARPKLKDAKQDAERHERGRAAAEPGAAAPRESVPADGVEYIAKVKALLVKMRSPSPEEDIEQSLKFIMAQKDAGTDPGVTAGIIDATLHHAHKKHAEFTEGADASERPALRWGEVAFDEEIDAAKFAKLIEKSGSEVIAVLSGKIVTTNATSRDVHRVLERNTWKEGYKISKSVLRYDAAAESVAAARRGPRTPAYMRVRPSDSDVWLDMNDLTGDHTPTTLAEFLRVNSAPEVIFPPDESEIAALRGMPVGGSVNLGIGGGFVTVLRVAPPSNASEPARCALAWTKLSDGELRATSTKGTYVVERAEAPASMPEAVSGAAEVVPIACKPFARLERDPEAYKQCMAWADKHGPITSARSVYDFAHADLDKLDTERFLVVGVDIHDKLRCYSQVGQGQQHKVGVDIEDVLQVLLIDRPDKYYILHNHPSGDANPSDKDEELTKRIRQAAEKACPNIKYADHVIIGRSMYYSFESGKVTKIKS